MGKKEKTMDKQAQDIKSAGLKKKGGFDQKTGPKAEPKVEPKAEIEKARKEAKENHDKWLYLRAEFENFKKRIQKEKAELFQFGHGAFARELLLVIDSLESALSHVEKKDGKASPLEEGIQLTVKQFLDVFAQYGINPIESVGKKFDPAFHEAVGHEEADGHTPGMVIREHRKGFILHDRLLRAAQVVVAKEKSK